MLIKKRKNKIKRAATVAKYYVILVSIVDSHFMAIKLPDCESWIHNIDGQCCVRGNAKRRHIKFGDVALGEGS